MMQPFRLKNLTLRNRIVMAPMLSRLCDPDGIVSQKLIDYYAERAKGGLGPDHRGILLHRRKREQGHTRGNWGSTATSSLPGWETWRRPFRNGGPRRSCRSAMPDAPHRRDTWAASPSPLGHAQLHRGDGPGDDPGRNRGHDRIFRRSGAPGQDRGVSTAWSFTEPTAT